MKAACECGMALDRPTGRLGCQECGTPICRSCVIELDQHPYCRWCAPIAGVGSLLREARA